MVAEQVSVQWVMEAHRANAAEGACQEDVAQPADGVELGLEVDVVPPPTEPKIVQLESEQHLSSPVAPIADAIGQPQKYVK